MGLDCEVNLIYSGLLLATGDKEDYCRELARERERSNFYKDTRGEMRWEIDLERVL